MQKYIIDLKCVERFVALFIMLLCDFEFANTFILRRIILCRNSNTKSTKIDMFFSHVYCVKQLM